MVKAVEGLAGGCRKAAQMQRARGGCDCVSGGDRTCAQEGVKQYVHSLLQMRPRRRTQSRREKMRWAREHRGRSPQLKRARREMLWHPSARGGSGQGGRW